jgi:adenylate kinase
MILILFGPPGAGKGTQARLLKEKHHLALIATGDLFRDEIKRKTSLGLQVQEIIDSGRFPSDEIVLQILEEHLKKVKGQSLILDGVPRTLNQAQRIDAMFLELGLHLDMVIQLEVDDEELVKRLSSRVICKTCHAAYTPEVPPRVEGVCDACSGSEFIRRSDDEPEAIKVRLDVYNNQTKPLIDYYSKTHRLKVVDGMKSVEEVNKQIEVLLKESQVLTINSGCLYSAQDIQASKKV